jgi:hypothetical protein
MPKVPVTLFNANVLTVQVRINGGNSFTINATSGPLGFYPIRYTLATFNPGGPSTGVLGPGPNDLTITPQGALSPSPVTVTIPTQAQIISLQLYIYWDSYNDVQWLALNNGSVISSSF